MHRAPEIEKQAAEWLIRLDEHPSDARRADFDAWAAADLRHRAAYLRLSAAWNTTGRLKTLMRPDGRIDADLLKPRREPSRWLTPVLAAAASVLVGLVSLMAWQEARPPVDVYRTAIGGYSRIALVDGSTISLNTDSEVHVRLARDIRYIQLVRGEAIFEVAHDVHRPFDVHAGSNVIRAVGTSFDVRRRSMESVDVVVTEGNVSVGPDGSAVVGAARPLRSAMVAAGEAATVSAAGVEIKKVDRQETVRHLAWQMGELSFQGESLEEVIWEFNRYNRRQMELADASLRNLRVGGNFRATDIDSFVVALHSSFGVVADTSADGTRRIRRESALPASSSVAIVPQQ